MHPDPGDGRIALLELQNVMRSGKAFTLPYLAVLTALALIMWPVVPPPVLALWCAAYLLYIAARHTATLAFHKDAQHATPERIRYWRHWVMKSAAVHGFINGSPALMALPWLPQTQQFLLLWTAFATCAAAAIFTASLWPAVRLLLAAATIPYGIVLLFISPPVALFVFIAWVLFTYMGSHHHRALEEGFALVVRNEALARELMRKNLALEASNQSKTAVIAHASTELRQPVHALELAIAALDRPVTHAQLHERLREMQAPVSALSHMLADLADLGRLEAQAMPVRHETVPLDAVLGEIARHFGPEAAAKDLQFDVGRCSLSVQSDPELLRLIASHLVANAIRYTRAGTVRVDCVAAGMDAVLRVSDTGPGMASQALDKLADSRFVRLAEPRTGPQGLGIGLAIVRSAALLLGHPLDMVSTPGTGTTVSVHLPLLQAGGEPARQPMVRRTGQRIAVLETDPMALRGLCELLEHWGYRAAGGRTQEELGTALDGWAGARPHLFICELHCDATGETDGFDTVQAVRRLFGQHDLPALLVTDTLDAAEALRADSESIMLAHKPLGPQRLSRLLDSALQSPAPDAS